MPTPKLGAKPLGKWASLSGWDGTVLVPSQTCNCLDPGTTTLPWPGIKGGAPRGSPPLGTQDSPELPGAGRCEVVSMEEARTTPYCEDLPEPQVKLWHSAPTFSSARPLQAELSSPDSPLAGLQPLGYSLALRRAPGD